MASRRLSSYVVIAVLALALIGWLTARYLVKRRLVRALGTSNLAARVEPARKLLAMKKLEDALPAQPIIVRSKTAEALGEIRDEPLTDEAIRVLGVILRDQEEAPRVWARRALVKHGERAVSVLAKALAVGGGTLDEAVTALQQIGPAAAPHLRFLLSDRSSYKGASQSLAKMGQAGAAPLLLACYAVDADVRKQALADLAAAKVRAVLGPALDNLDPKLSVAAGITALGELGDRVAVPAILPFVAKKDNRLDAVIALGLIGDGRAMEPILSTLTERDKRFREQAVVALRRIVVKTGAPAYPPLVRELKSPLVLMRRAAAAALVAAKSATLNSVLEAALADPDSEVRLSAARALGWEGNTQTIGPLVSVLGDAEWRVVESAVRALAAIGPVAVPQLTAIIGKATGEKGKTVGYQIAMAMAQMGPGVLPRLVGQLSSPNPQVQTWCAVALGQLRDERAVKPLRELAKTASGNLKWVAEEQLRVLAGTAGS